MIKPWTIVLPWLLYGTAYAAEGDRPNTTATTWEIYAAVGLALVIGFAYVIWKQRREEDKTRKQKQRSVST